MMATKNLVNIRRSEAAKLRLSNPYANRPFIPILDVRF